MLASYPPPLENTQLQRHLELLGRDEKHRTINNKEDKEADQTTSIDVR